MMNTIKDLDASVIEEFSPSIRGEITTPQGELVWELRSVNHRYLETQFKLPDGFRALSGTAVDEIGPG